MCSLGGTPPDGYGPTITDTTALSPQNLKVAPQPHSRLANTIPNQQRNPNLGNTSRTTNPTSPRRAQRYRDPTNAGEQQTLDMQGTPAPPAPPADQAFLPTPQQNTNPAHPASTPTPKPKTQSSLAPNNLASTPITLPKPPKKPGQPPWKPTGNITANQVRQAIAWIKVTLSQRQPAAA